MKVCPRCRYPNQDAALVCNLCGENFTSATGEESSSAPTQRAVPPVTPAKPSAVRPSFGFPHLPGAGTPPPTAARPTAQLGFYLISHPYPPVKLAPGPEFIIGREKNTDLVLPATLVSRRHASVRWSGEHYVIKDLGSSNGTFVNGQRITEHTLAPGDKIAIGTFSVLFLTLTADQARKPDEDGGGGEGGTLTMDMQAVQAELGGWMGNLAEIGLAQILQVLESDHKSGLLSVRIAGENGELCFQDGKLVHAQFGELSGEEAVYPMFARQEGSFHFLPAMPEYEVTINTPLHGILLEATRRADESRRKS